MLKTMCKPGLCFLAAVNLLIVACNAFTYFPEASFSDMQGTVLPDDQVTRITLPEQWTATPSPSPAPTRTASPTPTPPAPTPALPIPLDAASTPYALETLGPDFSLADASITTADLPPGFISFSMHELFGEFFTAMLGEDSEFAELIPDDEPPVDFYSEILTSMNFTMLSHEVNGTSITSVAYLFNTEEEQDQFDVDLQQELDEPPEGFVEPEEEMDIEFSLMEGFFPVGDISQAVEMIATGPDETGTEITAIYRMVNFRRGPVGASLIVMSMEDSGELAFQALADALDARIVAALDAAGYIR